MRISVVRLVSLCVTLRLRTRRIRPSVGTDSRSVRECVHTESVRCSERVRRGREREKDDETVEG